MHDRPLDRVEEMLERAFGRVEELHDRAFDMIQEMMHDRSFTRPR